MEEKTGMVMDILNDAKAGAAANTGMIMDVVNNTADIEKKTEAMNAAISNDQMKKLEVLAKQWNDNHTPKVRKFEKIGRNDPCPCGSGKKYKNCCLNTGKFEGYKKITDK